MRRLPILATIVVLAAVAAMIGLGIWQLRRATWKEALLASYVAAEHRPMLDGLPHPLSPDQAHRLAFRRARLACVPEGEAVQIGGRNRAGQTGYRAVVPCRLTGPGWESLPTRIMLDLGWSAPGVALRVPTGEQRVEGRLIPDPQLAARALRGAKGAVPLLLVGERAAEGFEPSVPPSIEDIPNNHRAYAVQWFLFAGVAFIVYLLALRRRRG